jgi:hypothetical protein
MLLVARALDGYKIAALDGSVGIVSDFLFDDGTWGLRWLVVSAGGWWTDHTVLLQPSSITRIDREKRAVHVALTQAKIKSSPELTQDPPVSRQMEASLYNHYGWDPLWGGDGYFLNGIITTPLGLTRSMESSAASAPESFGDGFGEGDPHLRSIKAVTGAHIHAQDGDIGHLQNFLIDDATWSIRYLIADTSNWWMGKQVLLSPYSVREIDWPSNKVSVTVTRAQVKASPTWDPVAIIEQVYERRLHSHYGWRGYGW